MATVTVRDLDIRGRRVLARADFRVPLGEQAAQPDIADAALKDGAESSIGGGGSR